MLGNNIIGDGDTAYVWEAEQVHPPVESTSEQRKVAVKLWKANYSEFGKFWYKAREHLQNEMAIYKSTKNEDPNDPHLQGCHLPLLGYNDGFDDENPVIFLATPLASPILGAAKNGKKTLQGDMDLQTFTEKLERCVSRLHEQGFVHLDIKLDILVKYNGELVRIDFGEKDKRQDRRKFRDWSILHAPATGKWFPAGKSVPGRDER